MKITLTPGQQAALDALAAEAGKPREPSDATIGRFRRDEFVCSNPACGWKFDDDPEGHCPMCKTADGGGWSTIRRPRANDLQKVD